MVPYELRLMGFSYFVFLSDKHNKRRTYGPSFKRETCQLQNDTVSLKYEHEAHSVSYVTLQSPTGREFHQIFHQTHHYNESMQISAFPF